MSIFDRQRSGPQRSNTSSATFGTKEPTANFNFLGEQQQMSGQQPGYLQSLARQQSGISDAQLLQQQMTMKQMQEMQRQQQYQQLEAMQRNTMNQMPLYSNQAAGNHAASFINGSPMHEPSNYPWSSQVMSGNPNWLQHGGSPAMQGYTNGVVMPPVQGQAVHLMGLNPQQAPPSLYGVPVSGARSEGGFLMNQVDKTALHQVSLQGNFSDNQHSLFMEQMNMRGGPAVSRQGFEGKGSFEYASRQGSVNAMSAENFNEIKQRSLPALDARQDMSVSPATHHTTNQSASSQAPVGLDPTEEKILFGDDDENIWDAFGESLSGSTAAVNHLDGALPSMQSGSWSALMQSAVAESTGSDTGQQAEWRGTGVQNSGSLTGKQQPPNFLEGVEQPTGWFDKSSIPSMGSRPSPDTSLGSGYSNPGLQKSLPNQGDAVLNRSTRQASEEGKKWSDRSQPKAIVDGTRNHESDYGFGDFTSKSTKTSWNHQQRTSSMGNRVGDLNFGQSVSNHGFMSRDQEKFLANDGDRGMNLNIGDGGHTSMQSAGPDSNIEMGRQLNNTKNDTRVSDNKQQQEFWRSVSSDSKSGADGLGKYQQHLNKGMQRVLHSSTNSYDRGTTEIPETGSSDKRENSSDSYSSNLSNRASSGRMRENVWLDAGDTHGMSGGQQNSSGQGDIRVSYGISPGQIHPGYVSATPTSFDRSGGISTPNTPISSSQNMLELLHKVDQSKDHNTLANISSSDRSRQSNANDTEASGRNAAFSPPYSLSSQGFGLQLAPPSQGLPAPNFVVPSQNMSRTVNSPSSSYVASDKGDKSHAWLTSAGSGQSFASHDTQQVGAQVNRSDVPWHIHESLARNMQGNFPASFPSQSQHFKGPLHNQQMANVAALKVNQPGNASFNWQGAQDKQMPTAVTQRVNTPPSTDNSETHVQLHEMAALGVSSSLQASITPEMYQKGNLSSLIPNMRANSMSTSQQLLPGQSLNAAELFKNQFQLNSIPETSVSTQQKQEGQDTMPKGHPMVSQNLLGGEEPKSGSHADATQKTAIMMQGKEAFATIPADASVRKSVATKEDIQAFGRSLKPNSNLSDSYSLLHQMQAMKEVDPNILQAKRFNGLDNGPDEHLMVVKPEHSGGLSYAEKNASVRNNSNSSSDANMPTLKPEPGSDQEKHIPQQSVITASQDLSSRQGEPQKLSGSNAAASIADQSQMNMQMAPTWFKQFGTLKNGQLMSMSDLHRAQPAQNAEQEQFMNSKPSDYLAPERTLEQANAVELSQMENVGQKASQISTELTSPHLPLPPTLTSLRPRKRKRTTLDLLPWRKDVTLSYQRLPTISSAEEDWAQSAHRLIEKVEDETDVYEDVPPVVRSRRRLVRTTQLMQQILCPPPASVLSLDATTEFEAVAYITSRLALADACSLTFQVESDSCVSQDKENLPYEEPKASGKIRDQHIKKVVEQFNNREKNLENELSRLDKRVSVLDLRLECQDLERFSVINRFARFHGRGQPDVTETSTSSDAAAATQRARPQRYVNAYTAPKNLPERVQCLSL